MENPAPPEPRSAAERRAFWWILGIGLSLIALILLLFSSVVPPLMTEIARGDVPTLLAPISQMVTQLQLKYAGRPEEFWQLVGRVAATRFILCILLATTAALLWRFRERVVAHVIRFFNEPWHPLNLAVARIVVFAVLAGFASPEGYRQFLQIPRELVDPPIGLNWLRPILPPPESIGYPVLYIFWGACWAAMLGAATRWTAPLATILAFYILGLGQCYGKAVHWHHLIWFSALLSVSPCSDVLSLDAWKAHKQHPDREPPGPARAYGVPIRLMWLLLGVLYFWPGFWKPWMSGSDWLVSDNIKWLLYSQWYAMADTWSPPFRIDHYPVLLVMGTWAAVILELSYIGLVFWRRTRWIAFVGGLGFHTFVLLFIHVNFQTLMKSYVVLVDWVPVLRWLGTRFRAPALLNLVAGEAILPGRERAWRATWIVGLFLLAGNLYFGIRGIERAWPMASYPRYAQLQGHYFFAENEGLALELLRGDAVVGWLSAKELKSTTGLASTKYDMAVRRILESPDESERRVFFSGLVQLIGNRGVDLEGVDGLRFWMEKNAIDPDRAHENPISRRLYAEYPWPMENPTPER